MIKLVDIRGAEWKVNRWVACGLLMTSLFKTPEVSILLSFFWCAALTEVPKRNWVRGLLVAAVFNISMCKPIHFVVDRKIMVQKTVCSVKNRFS